MNHALIAWPNCWNAPWIARLIDCRRVASDWATAPTPVVTLPTVEPMVPSKPPEYCLIACWITATASFGVQSAL